MDSQLAGRVLWFDALIGNVDRSWHNPNMLRWHGALYLIDHDASLTFHHNWAGVSTVNPGPYDASEYALVRCSPDLDGAAPQNADQLGREVFARIVNAVPEQWLVDEPGFADADELRDAYVEALMRRLDTQPERISVLKSADYTSASHSDSRHAAPRSRPDWLNRSTRDAP